LKILLAVDSNTTLNILLDEVVGRSWPGGTEARVLSVVEDGEVPFEMWPEAGYGAVGQEMRRREEQTAALAIERLQALGIPTEVTIMRGNAEELIRFASRKWGTDLILILANNCAGNWLLGSVATSIVKSGPCSVEVVRAGDETHSGGDMRNFRILLATDGSNASLAAAKVVAHTNWPEFTEVKVVSVVNPVIYSFEEIGLWRDKGTDQAHRAIGRAVQTLKNAPLKITGEIIAGGIARGILDRARTWSADLIVLGTHDRRGLKRFFLSNIPAVVVKRARCSVRVVRGRLSSEHEESSHLDSSELSENARSISKNVGLRRAA
jgi:nucleotide-binding universal stress UspA family protein